jgi:hypothetical protein
MAIGFDDTLELLEDSTPLQFDFVAGHYTGERQLELSGSCRTAVVVIDAG